MPLSICFLMGRLITLTSFQPILHCPCLTCVLTPLLYVASIRTNIHSCSMFYYFDLQDIKHAEEERYPSLLALELPSTESGTINGTDDKVE